MFDLSLKFLDGYLELLNLLSVFLVLIFKVEEELLVFDLLLFDLTQFSLLFAILYTDFLVELFEFLTITFLNSQDFFE